MNMRLLLLLLFGSVVMYTSCQSTSAPIDSLAARVTENTSKDQILFRLVTDEADPAKDYFEIDSKDGKVLITGNSDLSLATGLNWYLKYVAGIHLSWNNPSQKLPEVLPLPQKENPTGDGYEESILPELLYLFLLHGFLGLGTLGERDRLDGDARHQYAFEYNRDGGCLV